MLYLYCLVKYSKIAVNRSIYAFSGGSKEVLFCRQLKHDALSSSRIFRPGVVEQLKWPLQQFLKCNDDQFYLLFVLPCSPLLLKITHSPMSSHSFLSSSSVSALPTVASSSSSTAFRHESTLLRLLDYKLSDITSNAA